MNVSTKRAFYSFGGVTAFFVLTGGLFLAMTLLAAWRLGSRIRDIGGPYAALFFGVYSLVNVAFLAMLATSAVRLLRTERRGVGLLALTLKLELGYFLAAVGLCFLPEGFGRGAAAAFGVGNMGISPQLYIAYPLTGSFGLWWLHRRGILSGEPALAPQDGSVGPSDNSGTAGGRSGVS